MKNSVNYSGFLDLVYSSNGEKTSDDIKQLPVHGDTKILKATGESPLPQRSVRDLENINST